MFVLNASCFYARASFRPICVGHGNPPLGLCRLLFHRHPLRHSIRLVPKSGASLLDSKVYTMPKLIQPRGREVKGSGGMPLLKRKADRMRPYRKRCPWLGSFFSSCALYFLWEIGQTPQQGRHFVMKCRDNGIASKKGTMVIENDIPTAVLVQLDGAWQYGSAYIVQVSARYERVPT